MNTEEILKYIYLLLVGLFIKRMKILGTQRQEKSYLTKEVTVKWIFNYGKEFRRKN